MPDLENKHTIQNLLAKIISDQSTDEEIAQFFQLVRQLPVDDELVHTLDNHWDNVLVDREIADAEGEKIRERLSRLMQMEKAESKKTPAHIRLLKKNWVRYVAAAVLVMGLLAIFWFTDNQEDRSLAGTDQLIKTNIPPGSNKAILTLGDNSTIVLDSAAYGLLSMQGNASIIKTGDGTIAYNLNKSNGGKAELNSIVTPRGGQFQLTLADGTRVWLNAASSIEYPSAFPGNSREVRITGEAYFEVAPDKQKPFIVKVNTEKIEVLGTAFNINAYADEPQIRATLLEGSIKITKGNDQQILRPGQQAQYTSGSTGVTLFDDANIEEVVAWKNGSFDFSDQDIEVVMRQIGRWYNMDIVYEGKKTSIHIMSVISRNTDLSTVLHSLELVGLRCRVEESKAPGQPGKIIVLQ